jgi:protein SCO1/2
VTARRQPRDQRSRGRLPLLLAAAILPALVIYVVMLRSQPPLTIGGANLDGLVDQRGRTIGSETFRDRYKLLAFGYTQCPEACPATLMKLRVVLTGLGSPESPVVPLFVTIDPEHDTPGVLGEYTARFDPRIVAISGDRSRLERYARAYGALPPADAGGQPADGTTHAVRIYLLAPDNSLLTTYALTDPTPLVVADVERRVAAALPARAPRADASG